MKILFNFSKICASIAEVAFENYGITLFIFFLIVAITCLMLYIIIDKSKN